MFLWTGCTCQVLWTCAFLSLRLQVGRGDFAPIIVYSALALAGIALTKPPAAQSHARQHDSSLRLPDAAPRTRAESEVTASGSCDLGAHINAEVRPCRIMAIGPLATVQSVLGPLFQSSGLIVEYAETAGIALQEMRAQPRSDLPKILIMPWVLPVVESAEFIRGIKSGQRLGSMTIIVWGAGIPAQLIQSFYEAGAACVIPSQLDEVMCQALHHFCTTIGAQHSENGTSGRILHLTSGL